MEILAAGYTPSRCISGYCAKNRLRHSKIINKLKITPETAHLADHAVKFVAIDADTKCEKVFIACFKFAKFSGIYLSSVKEVLPTG